MKTRLNLTIAPKIIAQAKAKGINISQAVEDFLTYVSADYLEVRQGWAVVDVRTNKPISVLFDKREHAEQDLIAFGSF